MELTIELFEKILDDRLKHFAKEYDFATKKDLQKELKRFATKEDLKNFATKEDMEAQTKELKDFAIEQTESLARIVNHSFVGIENRMDRFEKSLNELKKQKVF